MQSQNIFKPKLAKLYVKKRLFKKEEEQLIENTKKISVKEGSFYSVHDGFGLRYVTPFALQIGRNNPLTNLFIGFLTSIPSLLSNVSQIFTSRLIEKYPRKKIVSTGVYLQALMWLFVIISGSLFFIFKLSSTLSLVGLLIFYTLLILFGAIVSPAWVSWMKDIVVKDKGKFFGKRNRITGIIAIVAMLVGGIFLDFTEKFNVFLGFAILFFVAFLARSTSGKLFKYHYEPKLKLHKGYYFSFKDFVLGIPKHNFARFTLFTALFLFATSIASPFFSVYMLKELNFSYTYWIIIILSSSVSSFLTMPLWGKITDRYGTIKIVKLTGFLIPFVPLLWVVSPIFTNSSNIFYYLITVELFSGFVWAGYNLGAGNFIYSTVTRERVALCSAYYNVLHGIGIFLGATLGGILTSIDKGFIFGLNSLIFVFLLSAILRVVVYFSMVHRFDEVAKVKKFPSFHEIFANFFHSMKLHSSRPI